MSEQLELFPDLVAGPNELWDFARWVITQTFEDLTLEGDDIQERALALGLIRATVYDPALHGEREDYEPGTEWLEFTGPLAEKPT